MRLGPENENYFSWLLCFAVGLAGAVLWYWTPIKGLGEAFLIAGILGILVDPFLKRRLLREASKDIFHHLIGFDLPDEIKERIKEIAVDTKLYRKNLVTTCSFCREDGVMRIDFEHRFEVVNPTKEKTDFWQVLQFEEKENPVLTRVFLTAERQTYSIPSPKLERGDDPDVLEFRKRVTIHPLRQYIFGAEYSLRLPLKFFHVQHFAFPTIGAALIVRSHPPDLTVRAGLASLDNENEWRWKKLFMPGEHFVIRWE